GDLGGVEGGAFAQVVGDDPHGEAVGVGKVVADAANEDVVFAGGEEGHRVLGLGGLIDHGDTGRAGQDAAGFGCAHGAAELDVDSFGMADLDGHAHGGGGDGHIRIVEDLAGFGDELHLLGAIAIGGEGAD